MHVHRPFTVFSVLILHFGQVVRCAEGLPIPFLGFHTPGDGVYLGASYETALNALRRSVLRNNHIPVSKKLLRSCLIEYDAGIDVGFHGEGDTHGEVRLDKAGDDIPSGRLRRDNKVDTAGASHLGEGDDGGHDALLMSLRLRPSHSKSKLRVLVNDHHDIWKIPVAVLRVELVGHELRVVLLNLRSAGTLEEVITLRHLLAQRAKDLVRPVRVLDDGPRPLIFFGGSVWDNGQIM